MTSVPFSSHSNTDMNAPCFALTSSFSAGFSWGKCANILQKSALCLRLIDEASRAHISLIAPSDTSRCPRRCENFQSVGGCLCFCHPLSNNIRGCGVSDSALLRQTFFKPQCSFATKVLCPTKELLFAAWFRRNDHPMICLS